MAKIDISIQREFEVSATEQVTFKFLADTPKTLAHYPKLEKLVDLGDRCWRWELEPVGVKGISHQLIYSVQYGFDKEAGHINWTPLKADTDNAQIQGRFEISATENGSHVVLDTDGSLTVPIPKLIAAAAKPIIQRELAQQIEVFVANLQRALNA